MKRFCCKAGKLGTFSVIDLSTGKPADVGATSILLTRSEAIQLASRLDREKELGEALLQEVSSEEAYKVDQERAGAGYRLAVSLWAHSRSVSAVMQALPSHNG